MNTPAPVEALNGDDWNPIHRALILSLRGANETRTNAETGAVSYEAAAAEHRALLETALSDITTLTDAIDAGGYTPPEGFDMYGNVLPVEEPTETEEQS